VSSKSEVRQCWTIVWQMMSVEMARTAVGRTTIECCVHWCAMRCAGSDTAEMTSAESWTSARPTYSWCAVQQAASTASDRRGACRTVYAPRCSGLFGASEWCRMERHAAQSCSNRFSRESGCMRASVRSPASVDGVCGGSHARGNCTNLVRLMRKHDAQNKRWNIIFKWLRCTSVSSWLISITCISDKSTIQHTKVFLLYFISTVFYLSCLSTAYSK